MKKTKNITKYDLQWQLLRVSVKGSKVSIEEKLSRTRAYFVENHSYCRWERVYNWLEGLERGYKNKGDQKTLFLIKEEFSFYKDQKQNTREVQDRGWSIENVDSKDLVLLCKDLFKTNEKWLSNGYFHEECNSFLDSLFNEIKKRGVEFLLGEKYQFYLLEESRLVNSSKVNKHKFFF